MLVHDLKQLRYQWQAFYYHFVSRITLILQVSPILTRRVHKHPLTY